MMIMIMMMTMMMTRIINVVVTVAVMMMMLMDDDDFAFQQKPPYDANKLYSSEILSILLQSTQGLSSFPPLPDADETPSERQWLLVLQTFGLHHFRS